MDQDNQNIVSSEKRNDVKTSSIRYSEEKKPLSKRRVPVRYDQDGNPIQRRRKRERKIEEVILEESIEEEVQVQGEELPQDTLVEDNFNSDAWEFEQEGDLRGFEDETNVQMQEQEQEEKPKKTTKKKEDKA